jgi:predicted nicotinamide N-methyase
VTPPYWALAWASGQVLARYLLDHPAHVRGKRVIDFGTGSGIVALAAKLAGAREVLAVDRDVPALDAAIANADAMSLSLSYSTELPREPYDVLLAADVLYDRDNAGLLETFRLHAEGVVIAESRFDVLPDEAFREIHARTASTVPDIDESARLKHVRIFELVRPRASR